MSIPDNSPLVVWAKSETMLRYATTLPQPVSVLAAFTSDTDLLYAIAKETGFNCKQIDNQNALESRTIYFFAPGKSFSLPDLTSHQHMIRELEGMMDSMQKRAMELTESNAELERFAYVASHDLQEPLRMVTRFLQLLKKKYDDRLDDTARQYIAFALEGTERMKRLIHDLLEYLCRGELLFALIKFQ